MWLQTLEKGPQRHDSACNVHITVCDNSCVYTVTSNIKYVFQHALIYVMYVVSRGKEYSLPLVHINQTGRCVKHTLYANQARAEQAASLY